MGKPFINRSQKKELDKTRSPFGRQGFPRNSPYEPNQRIIFENTSVGNETKTCPVNDEGKTIFYPEWYHGKK